MAEDRRGQRPERGNGAGRGGQGRSDDRRSGGGQGGRSGGPSRGGQGGSSRGYQGSRDGDDRRSGGQGGRSGGPSRGGQGGSSRGYQGSRPSGRDGDERRGSWEDRKSGPRSGAGSRGQGGQGRDDRKGGWDDRKSGGPSRGGQGGQRGGYQGNRDGDDRRGGGPRRDGGQRRDGGREFSRERKGGFRRDEQVERTAEQARYDGPPLPDHITGKEIDRNIAAQLKGLPEKLASRVAKHLAAAAELIDSDPETAYQHTLAARSRAARLAVVREAAGEAAYAAGHYAEALSDLRAAKRMNGAPDYLPIMADCHRALKQPEQALKLAKSPSVKNFAPEAKAEMTIVEAGARRDMGQLDAALRTLELAPLMHKSRASWVVRLRYAYADTLLAAGREDEALAWFHRTHAIDADEITDASDRADLLERRQRD